MTKLIAWCAALNPAAVLQAEMHQGCWAGTAPVASTLLQEQPGILWGDLIPENFFHEPVPFCLSFHAYDPCPLTLFWVDFGATASHGRPGQNS